MQRLGCSNRASLSTDCLSVSFSNIEARRAMMQYPSRGYSMSSSDLNVLGLGSASRNGPDSTCWRLLLTQPNFKTIMDPVGLGVGIPAHVLSSSCHTPALQECPSQIGTRRPIRRSGLSTMQHRSSRILAGALMNVQQTSGELADWLARPPRRCIE